MEELTAEQIQAFGEASARDEQTSIEEQRTQEVFTGSGRAGYEPGISTGEMSITNFGEVTPEDSYLVQAVKNSAEYKALEGSFFSPLKSQQSRMINAASTENNEAVYNNTGRERKIDLPGEILDFTLSRVQDVTDEDGNKTTLTVPRPSEANSTDRVKTGMLDRAVKGLTGLGAFAVDSVAEGVEFLGDKAFSTGRDDSYGFGAKKYIDENMAVMPSDGSFEEIGQEVGSVLMGGGGGALGVQKLLTTKFGAKVAEDLGQGLAGIWKSFKKTSTNPKDWQDKWNTVAKAFLTERGVNLGATIAEPDLDPMIVSQFGVTGEEYPALATWLDNEAFSATLKTIGLVFKGVKEGVNAVRGKGGINVGTEPEAMAVLGWQAAKNLDSDLGEQTPAAIKAFRLNIFGEMLEKYKSLDLGALANPSVDDTAQALSDADMGALWDGTKTIDQARKLLPDNASEEVTEALFSGRLDLDTATAMVTGAREYVERAYAYTEPVWKKQNPDGDFVTDFIDVKANEIAGNILAMRKQAALTTPDLARGTTTLTDQTNSILSSAGDNLVDGATNIESTLAEPVLENLNPSASRLAQAEDNAFRAGTDLDVAQQTDVGEMLGNSNPVNLSGENSVSQAVQTIGDNLVTASLKEKQAINAAFDALPSGVPIDAKGLVESLTVLKNATTDFGEITSTASTKDPVVEMLRRISPQPKRDELGKVLVDPNLASEIPGKPMYEGTVGSANISLSTSPTEIPGTIYETADEVAERLLREGVDNNGTQFDLKYLNNTVRPNITALINSIAARGGKPPAELIDLKRFITDAVEVASKKDPQWTEAMKKYAENQARYSTDVLRPVNAAVDKINPNLTPAAGEEVFGQTDAVEAAIVAINVALVKNNDAYSTQILDIMKRAGMDDPFNDLSNIYISKTLMTLASELGSGKPLNRAAMMKAIEGNLTQLRRTNPDLVNQYQAIIKSLDDAEAGVVSADKVVKSAQDAHNLAVELAEENAASVFLENVSSSFPQILQNSNVKWPTIFGSDNAPEKISQLLSAAAGNPVIVNGIKGKYVKFLQEKITNAGSNTGIVAGDGGIGSAAKNTDVSVASLDKILNSDFDGTLKTIQTVFKDSPKQGDQLIGLLRLISQVANQRNVKVGGGLTNSDTAMNLAGNVALSGHLKTMVMLGFGILNPTATKLNRLADFIATSKKDKSAALYQEAYSKMIQNPEDMAEAMRLGAKDQKAMMSRIYNIVGKRVAQLVFVGARDKDEEFLNFTPTPPPEDAQTEDMLGDQ